MTFPSGILKTFVLSVLRVPMNSKVKNDEATSSANLPPPLRSVSAFWVLFGNGKSNFDGIKEAWQSSKIPEEDRLQLSLAAVAGSNCQADERLSFGEVVDGSNWIEIISNFVQLRH